MDCRDEGRKKAREHLANFHNLGWINLYSKEMMEAVHQEIGKHVKRRCQVSSRKNYCLSFKLVAGYHAAICQNDYVHSPQSR